MSAIQKCPLLGGFTVFTIDETPGNSFLISLGPLIPGAIIPGAIIPGDIIPGAIIPGAIIPGDIWTIQYTGVPLAFI